MNRQKNRLVQWWPCIQRHHNYCTVHSPTTTLRWHRVMCIVNDIVPVLPTCVFKLGYNSVNFGYVRGRWRSCGDVPGEPGMLPLQQPCHPLHKEEVGWRMWERKRRSVCPRVQLSTERGKVLPWETQEAREALKMGERRRKMKITQGKNGECSDPRLEDKRLDSN